MKKEWLFQIIAFIIFCLNAIIYVEHEGIIFSDSPGVDLIFVLYETILFLIVNYVLIPKLFHTKKYLLFFLSLIGLIILFGVVEEGVVEKIFTPNSRGTNDVTWQSIYWFFGEILIPLLAFMTIKFVFDNFKQEQRLAQLEQDRLSNELKLLKSQIQPHILFNSLNNLYNFALKKSEQVPDLIIKLSNVLRYVLYEASDEKVTLHKELTLIKDYVALQEIQYKGRGKIILDIENNDQSKELKIAPFLLIPFVENSFKHSFGTLIDNVIVEIKIKIEDGYLLTEVKNNFDINDGASNSLVMGGIGLKNVGKRLNLLYPKNHTLKTWTENKFYYVDLKILLIE